MSELSSEPVFHIVVGLIIVLILVLILPFKVRVVEENLELFFLVMGVLAVTISGQWSVELIKEALKEPVWLPHSPIPIGIVQVVLIFGLIVYKYNQQIYKMILNLIKKVGLRLFTALVIISLGLTSSIISVIVAATILAEIALALPIDRHKKIEFVVIGCLALGFGAALTPVGEPLSAIAVSKLKGEPYYADFFFLLNLLGHYIIPGIIALGVYGAYRMGSIKIEEIKIPKYTETLRTVIIRALRVYMFVSALILLGTGLSPLARWYLKDVPAEVLYWINTVSAVLDNATLVAIEIEPVLTLTQIKYILISLIISGGMLIPGNIPNIVAAGRIGIKMREWARIGVPISVIMLFVYFVILEIMNV